jgi:hypothetical protein
MQRPSLFLLLSLSLLSIATTAACSVTTTEPAPTPTSTPASETPSGTPAADEPGSTPPAKPAETPAAPKDIDKLTLSGKFDNVDVTYERAGQFIVLDMKGDAATTIKSSDKSVLLSKIMLTKSTSYDLLFPKQGACDGPPEVTIEKGAVHLDLQRGGKPNGTISGCHFLAEYIKASDGGFQATIKDVPLQGGGKIKELVIDLLGP